MFALFIEIGDRFSDTITFAAVALAIGMWLGKS